MPVNAPNFGTGAVDWGSYVNPNQQTIDQDRAQVALYLQGLPQSQAPGGTGGTTAPSTAPAPWAYAPGANSPLTPTGAAFLSNPMAPPDMNSPTALAKSQTQGPTIPNPSQVFANYNQSQGIANTNGPTGNNPLTQQAAQSALATPTGFEALFNQSKDPSAITPSGSLPKNPYGAGQDVGWDAALSGQNAQAIKAPSYNSPAAAPANPGFTPPLTQRPGGPAPNTGNTRPNPQGGEAPEGQDNSQAWQRYQKYIGGQQ